MSTLKDFLSNLAKKSGMDMESDPVKNFLESLNGQEVPEEIEKGIDNSLISITDAKNNHTDIGGHYKRQALNAVDKNIETIIEEFEFDEDSKNEILGERSSYKRINLLVNKIKELESKKAGANKGDKNVYQKQIDDLHSQIKTEKEAAAKLKEEFNTQMNSYKINSQLSSLLNPVKTIYDDLDPEIKNTTISTIINKELQDNGVQFAFDENGKFSILKKDGTNFYGENHQQITPKQFIETTLSKNKLIKIQNTSPKDQNPPPGGDGKTKDTTLQALVQESLKDIENSSSVAVMG